MKYIILVFLISFAIADCSGSHKNAPQAPASTEKDDTPTAVDIDILEDSRLRGPGFEIHAKNPDWQIRRRAAEAMGRIGSREFAPLLLDLLHDQESAVRDAATFASGMLGPGIPENLKNALLTQLERETRADGTAALLDALSRDGSESLSSTFVEFAENPSTPVRAAALKSLGMLGLAGAVIPGEHLKEIAEYLSDPHDTVRLMAAFALYRLPLQIPTDKETLKQLEKAAREDRAVEVRAYALRAFARRGSVTPDLLASALRSESPVISATGVSIIDFAPKEDRCPLATSAIRHVSSRLVAKPALLQTAFIHTVRAALEHGGGCPGIRNLKSLEQIANLAKDDPVQSAGSARILCQTYELSGVGDVVLVGCDPTRPHVGKRVYIDRLGRGDPANSQNLTILRSLTEDPDPRVATSAIGVLAAMGGSGAAQIVVDSLQHKNQLCVAAALDGIAAHPDNFKKLEGSVLREIDALIDRFSPFEHVYAPIVSALAALKALSRDDVEPLLRKLAVDTRPAIRYAVIDAYAAFPKMTPPPGLPRLSPPNTVTKEQVELWRSEKAVAHVSTTRGAFSFSLSSSLAPSTVGRFIDLAESGYYDETEIHRVVPNFVVQAGDKTGTGLGDPGYAIRSELSSLPFERGTVGIALSGKDTGGSQFFVTLSRQPHLDGNYAAFGRVKDGMGNVDLIEEGDIILGISIER